MYFILEHRERYTSDVITPNHITYAQRHRMAFGFKFISAAIIFNDFDIHYCLVIMLKVTFVRKRKS